MTVRVAGEAASFWCKIYMSGPIDVAKQVIRKECAAEGLCVTIEPTLYIYTGGEEQGYVVGLIQYPRFPKDDSKIFDRAMKIASLLLEETHQASGSIVTPSRTIYLESSSMTKGKRSKQHG